jgi:flagellar motor switch/type III secretory pathway protein FliN
VQSDSKEPAIRPLEFPTAGQNQSDAALATLSEIALHYCRELRRAIPFLGRQRARVAPGPPAPLHDEASLPPFEGPSYLVELESPEDVWAAVHFDGAAILALVDGLFGAAADPPDEEDGDSAPEERQRPPLGEALTLAQKALIGRLSADIATPLAALVQTHCQAKLAIVQRTSMKRDEIAVLPDDAIGIDCRVEDVPNPWSVRLLMGAVALERLGAAEGRASSSAAAQPTLAAAATRIPVTVVAELGRVTLKLSQVLGLRSGDTLRLPAAANDPVVVRVEGVPKFDAVPVISRGQVAVKIHSRHSE